MTQSLADLLKAQTEKRPDHIALVQNNLRITYRDLWRRIERVAADLQLKGVCAGDPVVLLLDNSIDYIAAWYAVDRLAAVTVPLNTGLKGTQLRQVIAHTRARLIVYSGPNHEIEAMGGGDAEEPIALFDLGKRASPGKPPPVFDLKTPAHIDDPGGLASIVYTSGTTGRPKGVMLSRRNLVANTLAILDYLALNEGDRSLCLLPFYYAYGGSILHTHLAAGATIVLGESLLYPHKALEAMERESVTGFAGVPSTFRLLLERCDLSRFSLPRLRYVTQAGGAMSPADIERVRSCWPGARFFVMYGQTEATARLSYLPPERLDDKAGSVGLPVSGVRISILDGKGREKPRGEVGEICATGPNIMQGYWRDEAATRQKFFSEWLRTGDLGFQDEEGFITIIGRSSEMIKVGDHRISPQEVEEILARIKGVEEVAVAGAPDRILGQVIKAYVVPSPGCVLDQRDILRQCRRECASYKVPKQVIFLSKLPKTASGKVQRFKLPDIADAIENCV